MNKENKTSDKQQNGNDFIADVSISYDEGIEELKRRHPEYKDVKFEVWNTGEIAYSTSSYHGRIDMNKIQKEYNEIMGMDDYVIELKVYESCFARSEEEAKEYAREVMPDGFSVDTVRKRR